MVKGGAIWKLKRLVKKWHSFSRVSRSKSSSSVDSKPSDSGWSSDSASPKAVPGGYQAVYVGKSKRRYVVSSQHVDHPLLRELVEAEYSDGLVVGCEVVLFEHLLWMLDNTDTQPDSLDELADYYTY